MYLIFLYYYFLYLILFHNAALNSGRACRTEFILFRIGKLVAAGPGYDARSKIILDLYLSECAAVAGPGPRRGGELPAGRVIPTNTAARAPTRL